MGPMVFSRYALCPRLHRRSGRLPSLRHRVLTGTFTTIAKTLTSHATAEFPGGSRLVYKFEFTTTATTIGGETISIPSSAVDTTSKVYWSKTATTFAALQSSGCGLACECLTSGSNQVCTLGTGDFATGSTVYFFLVPATTLTGPWDAVVTFSANYMQTATVDLSASIVGTFALVTSPAVTPAGTTYPGEAVAVNLEFTVTSDTVGNETLSIPEYLVESEGIAAGHSVLYGVGSTNCTDFR